MKFYVFFVAKYRSCHFRDWFLGDGMVTIEIMRRFLVGVTTKRKHQNSGWLSKLRDDDSNNHNVDLEAAAPTTKSMDPLLSNTIACLQWSFLIYSPVQMMGPRPRPPTTPRQQQQQQQQQQQ